MANKKLPMKTLIFATLALLLSCDDDISPNRNGCITATLDNGTRFVLQCATKKQFDERDETVIPKGTFDVYKRLTWDTCDDCK